MSAATVARTIALRFGVALVVAAVLLSLMVVGINWQLDSRIAGIERVDVTVDTTPRPAKAGNYLVVGSDTREFAEEDPDLVDSFGDPDGNRADSVMIAHVDPDPQELFVVSIPRDTVVDLPGGGRSKLADVFNDGPQALVDVIGTNFDVPITHYLNVDFAGFDHLVDLVGPVTVHFNAPARDRKSGLHVAEAGCRPLDGEQALAYVRSRYYEENVFGQWVSDPTSDFGRIKRQQAFLRQLALMARDSIYGAGFDAGSIVDAVLGTIKTDQGFGRDQILGFIDRFRDVDPYDPSSVEMITLPVVNGPAGTGLGDILVLDQPAADEVLERIRTFGTRDVPDRPDVPPEAPPADEPPTAEPPVDGPDGADGAGTAADDPFPTGLSDLMLPDAVIVDADGTAQPLCG